jgi:hypothetical protein
MFAGQVLRTVRKRMPLIDLGLSEDRRLHELTAVVENVGKLPSLALDSGLRDRNDKFGLR